MGALQEVHPNTKRGHHFGRVYVTAHQLAIEVHAANPQTRRIKAEPDGHRRGALS